MEGCWHFQGQRDKFLTVGILGVLLLMTTLDMLFDWVNLSLLQSMDFRHTLVVGPPPHSAVTALLFFNILGTLTYVFECYNTFTILTHARHMRIPVVYEQAAVLLIVKIPLASINLSIVTCRQHHTSTSQVLTGVFAVVNVAVRLYLYGWYREHEYSPKESSTYRTTLKVAIYITVSVLWLALIITCAFTWQGPWIDFDGFSAPYGAHWLPGVSVVLIGRSYWERPQNFSFDPYIDEQGLDPARPWLLGNIDFIYKDPAREAYAEYPCLLNKTAPHLCQGATHLRFHFKYFAPSPGKPFGSIHYNFAAHRLDNTCHVSDSDLYGNWTLTYLQIRKERNPYSGEEETVVHPPWPGTCTLPTPQFDTGLKICPGSAQEGRPS